MHFQGAIIEEQGVKFAVAFVEKNIIDNSTSAKAAIQSFQPVFPGMPIVLVAQDSNLIPMYYGRPDVSRLLANMSVNTIPWQEYTIR